MDEKDIPKEPLKNSPSEIPPGSELKNLGAPRKNQLEDLLPSLGPYKIEDIVNNKEMIAMIVHLLVNKTEELKIAKDDIEKLRIDLAAKSSDYTEVKTKLGERWKSLLATQIITFISALCISFAFKFDLNTPSFFLFLAVGIIAAIASIVMPFVINKR